MKVSMMMSPLALALALSAGAVLAGENCQWEGKPTHTGAKSGSPVEKSTISADAGKQAERRQRFPEIQQAELVKAVHDNAAFIVDANGNESYASAHIPGAVSFDKSTGRFSKDLPADKGALIVAYCGGPGCEAWCGAADKLQSMGYKNIRHYKGGIKGWKEAGLETASAKGKG
jgi:rhodanese-related sulfurtransferase